MAKVTVPDGEGNLRSLMLALEDLHRRAGRPSLRAMADGQSFSYGSVHTLFAKTSERVPPWRVVQGVVTVLAGQALGSDPDQLLNQFHTKWVAAEEQPFNVGTLSDSAEYDARLEDLSALVYSTQYEPSPSIVEDPYFSDAGGVRPWKIIRLTVDAFTEKAAESHPHISLEPATRWLPEGKNVYILDMIDIPYVGHPVEFEHAYDELTSMPELFFLVRKEAESIVAWSIRGHYLGYAHLERRKALGESSRIPALNVKRAVIESRLCQIFFSSDSLGNSRDLGGAPSDLSNLIDSMRTTIDWEIGAGEKRLANEFWNRFMRATSTRSLF